MKLLVFAHRGEAQTFLKSGDYKSHPRLNDLYQGDSQSILLLGEGVHNVMSSLSFALALIPEVTSVINLGIAGSLNKDIPIGTITPIRTCYKSHEFKSYTFHESGLDLITVDERVLDESKRKELINHAPLVDRELWAIGFVCKSQNIKCFSYKLISDHISEAQFCQNIKDQALDYSDALFRFFIGLSKEDKENESINLSDDFYLTTSQEREVTNLLKSLANKENKTIDILISEIDINHYIETSENKKQRTKKLINDLNKKLYPFKYKVLELLDDLNKDIISHGASFKYDKNLEKVSFQFHCQIDSKEIQQLMAKKLRDYPFEKFEKIMNGEFDV